LGLMPTRTSPALRISLNVRAFAVAPAVSRMAAARTVLMDFVNMGGLPLMANGGGNTGLRDDSRAYFRPHRTILAGSFDAKRRSGIRYIKSTVGRAHVAVNANGDWIEAVRAGHVRTMFRPASSWAGHVSMSYFAPPPVVATTLFTRLPDRFRRPMRTRWADVNAGGKSLDCMLEGPSFDRQGRLYVVDIVFGRIFRISPEAVWEQIAEYDGWPNGLKIHRDGRIFIADYKRGIMILDPESGQVTPFLETAGTESFKGVNDLFFAANGDLFFTDQGQTGLQDASGRVFRFSSDGRLTCLLNTIPSPNGIVVDPEMTHVLVAVTRAQQIWRIPLHANGSVTKVGVFANLHGGLAGPDGLALDAEGNLLIAHTGFGSVWRLSPYAEPLQRIKSCAGVGTTNMAFGGPGNTSLFITESRTGSILRAELPVPGQTMFSHMD
jgi:gluconolactonase